jgi:FkbM family methyltransferase
VRFFVREATGRRVTARYGLREASDLAIFLRHNTLDVDVFNEIFSQRIYAVPDPIADRLERVDRIVDLGANIGLFAAWSRVRWPEARIVCFEPDPFNLRVLNRAAAANGWTVVPACAGTHEGEIAFAAGRYAISAALAEGETSANVIRVPVRDVLPVLADADLIKIDIEGGEWPILADSRFRMLSTKAVALEYHPQGCPNPDHARATAFRLLETAGYEVHDADTPAPAGYGSVWAWRS